MSNIDKRAVQAVADLKAGYTLGHADVAILNELARIALASLEAEAAAWDYELASCITCEGPQGFKRVIEHEYPPEWAIEEGRARNIVPLYAAPPAPVSVPDDMEMKPILTDEGQIVGYECLGERYGVTAGCAWNTAIRTFRAAMLQGAVQPQNQQQNIPENIPANTPCKEAPEHIWLQTAGAWPENGEFSELTWCSDNQHKDDTLYVRADVVTGNSPVIPDGWVMVPVDMTPEQMRAVQIESELGSYATENLSGAYALFREFWDVAVTAAPQQEVKP
ncbi:DUF551 domain-containing protein [Enterobacter kobei]